MILTAGPAGPAVPSSPYSQRRKYFIHNKPDFLWPNRVTIKPDSPFVSEQTTNNSKGKDTAITKR